MSMIIDQKMKRKEEEVKFALSPGARSHEYDNMNEIRVSDKVFFFFIWRKE